MEYKNLSILEYIGDIAARKMSPGGGSASALSASVGSALNMMVINFAMSPSKSEKELEVLRSLKVRQERIIEETLSLIDEDCVVFKELMSAIRSSVDTPDKYLAAASVPMNICRVSRSSMDSGNHVLDIASGAIIADISCSRQILLSAFYSAKINVEMNLEGISSLGESAGLIHEIKNLRTAIESDAEQIVIKLRQKGIPEGNER